MPLFLKKTSCLMPVVMILYLTVGIHAWAKASEGIDHYFGMLQIFHQTSDITFIFQWHRSNNFMANQLILTMGADKERSPANLRKGLASWKHLPEKTGICRFSDCRRIRYLKGNQNLTRSYATHINGVYALP